VRVVKDKKLFYMLYFIIKLIFFVICEKMKFVHKPTGIMGTKVAEDYKNKLGKNKVCICGKLDPMAQGKLLLLFDEDCKKMDENLAHTKTYQFKIAWGIQTDTDDTLGLITEEINIDKNMVKKLINNMEKYIEKYEGSYNQYFHKYSARTVHNENSEKHSLWEWTKLGRLDEIEIPYKEVSVEYIKYYHTEKKNMEVIKDEISENMKYIEGNFRQNEIGKQWENYDKKKEIWISTFEARVSTGYYIRQLIHTLGVDTGLLGMALDINRTYIHI